VPDWDERYRRGEHAGHEADPLLAHALTYFGPEARGEEGTRRALDLACGAGRHALLLASRGFEVTAVDNSRVAIELLCERARECDLRVDARVADLERGEFRIEPDAYDLVCDFHYLQRDLFAAVRASVRRGGLFVAAIHTDDDGARLRPMNSDFLLRPGELRETFRDWHVLHYDESKEPDPETALPRRRTARIVARRP
jgi:SAM-dependent methyltransferase